MSSLAAMRVLLFAGELFAGSTAIVVLAWLAATRDRASVRHLVWASAFGVLLLLPLLIASMPSPLRILLAAAPNIPPAQAMAEMATSATPPASADIFDLDTATIMLLLAAIWLAGAVAVMARWAIAATCLATLRQKSRPYGLLPDDLPQVASQGRECELRLAPTEIGPITFGVLRPVILLPHSAITWPRERLHAVLLHELAHIRRRDSFAQTAALLACAAYWPNPLVWFAARAMRREAEVAADDVALLSGLKPSHYAGELLALAKEFRFRKTAPAMALFMAGPSALETRVQSVLNPTNLRSGVTPMDIFKVAGVGVCAAALIAFACPSLAQDVSQQPLPAPAAPGASLPPDALPHPPAPPTPPALPTLPVPPTPPAPSAEYSPHEAVIIDGHGMHHLTAVDRNRIHAAVAKAKHEAREAVEKARPQIEQAIASAHIAEQSAREAQPQIDAAMEQVRRAQPQIDAAMDEVRRAQPEIQHAFEAARPEIDAALAKVRTELANEHLDAKIQMRVDEALKRAEIRLEAADMRGMAHKFRREERNEDRDEAHDSADDK